MYAKGPAEGVEEESSYRIRCCNVLGIVCVKHNEVYCPVGVEPPLAEIDHLWQEHFTHETRFTKA